MGVPIEPAEDKADSQKNTATPMASVVSTSSGGSLSSGHQNHPQRRLPAVPQQRTDPYPPGFRALATRLDKFSGRQAEQGVATRLHRSYGGLPLG